jgi:hypothetical protein
MTTRNELRLLPWSGPEGKPCYLSTDDQNGYMSRLADNIESVQLGTQLNSWNRPPRPSPPRTRARRTFDNWLKN